MPMASLNWGMLGTKRQHVQQIDLCCGSSDATITITITIITIITITTIIITIIIITSIMNTIVGISFNTVFISSIYELARRSVPQHGSAASHLKAPE